MPVKAISQHIDQFRNQREAFFLSSKKSSLVESLKRKPYRRCEVTRLWTAQRTGNLFGELTQKPTSWHSYKPHTAMAEVGTSAPESAPPLRAEHQFRSGMQRAEHAKKNGAE